MQGLRRLKCWLRFRVIRTVGRARFVACVTLVCFAQVAIADPPTAEKTAPAMLNGARQARSQRNDPLAIERFRAFLKDHAGSPQANAAHYELGVCLLETPNRDLLSAIDQLGPPASASDFNDRPLAEYYLGFAHRELGMQEWNSSLKTVDNSGESRQHLSQARLKFEEAAKHFASAALLFTARLKSLPSAEAEELPADFEWAAHARCDQAEALLRLDDFAAAATLTAPFAENRLYVRSRFRKQGLYYLGQADFGLREFQRAGRALSQLAPFDDPAFGLHARYLLGQVHQLSDERPEAVALYQPIVASYEAAKLAAQEKLRNSNAFKNEPLERHRLAALVADPEPKFIGESLEQMGSLLFADGLFPEAATKFAAFRQRYPNALALPEVQLRLGECQVHNKQYLDAQKSLQPLLEHPLLADQALRWLAKAQIGAADPNRPAQLETAIKSAIENLRKAADKAAARDLTSANAKLRYGETLLDLADAQQLNKQFRQAAGLYEQVAREKLAPNLIEEALLRQATALYHAGKFAESEALCQHVQVTYPKSMLLPAIAFCRAENSFGLSGATDPSNTSAANEMQLAEARKRYETVITKYPDFAQVSFARNGLATIDFRHGKFEDCAKTLGEIPNADRVGELSGVNYVMADCLIRTMPEKTADAVTAGHAVERLESAATLLLEFVSANANHRLAPDAWLKLGQCNQHVAAIVDQPEGRQKSLESARQSYDKLLQQFSKHPLASVAMFEKANCRVIAGDIGGAINELNRFRNDPLKSTPIAPLAVIRQATLMLAQNRAADAAKTLADCRQQHEAALNGDSTRRDWLASLYYQQGLALMALNKPAEALQAFEMAVKQFPTRSEGIDAAWRVGQIHRETQVAKLNEARKQLAQPNLKPEQSAPYFASREAAMKSLAETADDFRKLRESITEKNRGSESHLRLFYEEAGSRRLLGETENEIADQKIALAVLQAAIAGQTVTAATQQKGPLVQPSELRAREVYLAMITANSDVPQAAVARLELAEMLTARNEYEAALKLLNEAAEQDLSAESSELPAKIQLRLAHSLLATGDTAGATERFQAVAHMPKTPLLPDAQFGLGEVAMRQKQWQQAVTLLTPFRDQGPFQNVSGVSELALLRLAEAQAALGQWDASRQSQETLVNRFGNSPLVDQARYGIAQAQQNLKQFDQAVGSYEHIVRRTGAELAAKSQVQIGLCRAEQKRYPEALKALLIVPESYGYADTSAMALCEAARIHRQLNQPAEAARLLEKVTRQYADSTWAAIARHQLAEIR